MYEVEELINLIVDREAVVYHGRATENNRRNMDEVVGLGRLGP